MFKRRAYNTDEIVRDIRAGGLAASKAIDYLYNRYRANFVRFVQLKNGNKEDALDVFQDAVIVLVNNVERGMFKGDSNIKTYLFSIGKKLWYKKFNQNVKHSQSIRTISEDAEIPTFDPWETAQKELQNAYVKSIIDRLKKSHQEVLLLWMEGYDMSDIAQQMGLKNAQVARNYKSRAMKELNSLLADNEALRVYLFK